MTTMMLDAPLEDWFYEVKRLRAELEARAYAPVTRWVWLKGLTNPLNPEPWASQRNGFPSAKLMPKAPGRSFAARKGTFECGLDSDGRLCVQLQHWGGKEPYLNLILHLPGRIRIVRYGTDRYPFRPPEAVFELTLDGDGRVVRRESYHNGQMWPEYEPLRPEDVRALKAAPAWQIQHWTVRFTWKGDRLVKTDDGVFYDYEGDELVRIWRKNHTKADGEETFWKKGGTPWPFVLPEVSAAAPRRRR